MSHSTRSAGSHGPWQADDDLVLMDGSYTGPAVGDASPAGTLTVDGLTAGAGGVPGDTINVYEVASLVGRGPVLSPAFARNSSRRSSNPNNHRP